MNEINYILLELTECGWYWCCLIGFSLVITLVLLLSLGVLDTEDPRSRRGSGDDDRPADGC